MIDSLVGDLLPIKMIENEEPSMWLRGVPGCCISCIISSLFKQY